MISSAAVSFGFSLVLLYSKSGCQNAFRNGDQSQQIAKWFSTDLRRSIATNIHSYHAIPQIPCWNLLQFFRVQSAKPHFSGHFPNK